MKCAFLLLILSASSMAQTMLSLKVERVEHVLVLNNVFLNGTGPYRMVIDTGNSSSLVKPEVARRLGARAAYAVEQVTAAGVRRVPVVVLDEVITGGLTEWAVEAMVADVRLSGVDGVLGQSWLARHDYLLDYRHCRLVVDGVQPGTGLSMPLRSVDGRPLVLATVEGKRAELVLDSGAPALVLFQCQRHTGQRTMLVTNGDSAAVSETTTRITLPGDRERRMNAVCVNSAQPERGLLPASAFSAVFVSNRDGIVRLAR